MADPPNRSSPSQSAREDCHNPSGHPEAQGRPKPNATPRNHSLGSGKTDAAYQPSGSMNPGLECCPRSAQTDTTNHEHQPPCASLLPRLQQPALRSLDLRRIRTARYQPSLRNLRNGRLWIHLPELFTVGG